MLALVLARNRTHQPRGEHHQTALSWPGMLRMLVCLVAAAAVTGVLTLTASGAPNACQPTRGDGAGPFQPSGLSAPRRAKIGTGHVLQGRILRAEIAGPSPEPWSFSGRRGRPAIARVGVAAVVPTAWDGSASKDQRPRLTVACHISTSPSSTRPTKSSWRDTSCGVVQRQAASRLCSRHCSSSGGTVREGSLD